MVGQIIDERYQVIEFVEPDTYICENILTKIKWVLKSMDDIQGNALETLKLLRHPGLPRLFEYLSFDEKDYCVFEYIEGISLLKLCENSGGKIPWHLACEYMIEIAKIVFFLHTHTSQPLLHLDIKPSNIIITETGNVALIDFGCMSLETSLVKCTIKYAPPEVLGQNLPQKSSDIFMLGKTFLSILCGTEKDYSKVSSPATQPKEIPERIFEIIGKCTMHNPNDRYQNALELVSDIKDAITNERYEPSEDKIVIDVKESENEKYNKYDDDFYKPEPSKNKKEKLKNKLVCVWDNPYFAVEIAYILAHYEKKVLLIDADLLSPSIDLLLKINQKKQKYKNIERSSLAKLMESYSSGELVSQNLEKLCETTTIKNLFCLCGDYRMEDYEHYSTEGLAQILRLAISSFDFVIVNCSKFIYDEFACVSFICSDLILIPVIPNIVKIREYSKFINFLAARKQLTYEKIRFIGFDYKVNEDLSSSCTSELCGCEFLGNIEFSKKRRALIGKPNTYVSHMEMKIQNQYKRMLRKMKFI